jgi:hypothetical protein
MYKKHTFVNTCVNYQSMNGGKPMKKCNWCGKNTKGDVKKRKGMCASCWKQYKLIGKNLNKYA